jgi:amidohydrolase
MDATIKELLPRMITIRHQLHQNPELQFEVNNTAKLVADYLSEFDFTVKTNVGKSGVVGLLDTGKSGKTIALRADMDALPIQEKNNLKYKSQNNNMHACGHDGHTTILLTTAAVIAKHKKEFNGKIKLIFQPAEETGTGARAMIKDGVVKGVDQIFGLHNTPGLAVGKIAVKPDCILAGIDNFKITILGEGGHASAPEQCIDPIYIGTQIVQNLQGIVSRMQSPHEPLVISVTQFHAGTANNVIPAEAVIAGSIRTVNKNTQQKTKKLLEKIVSQTAKNFAAKTKIEYPESSIPTINHEKETNIVKTAGAKILGEKNVIELPHPYMFSEDFAYYLEKVPGCFFALGNGEKCSMLHTNTYNFCDDAIAVGVKMFTEILHCCSK